VPKTILITNIILASRTGTEVVVEQLADGLRRRGYRPILFAPQLGLLAERIRERGHFVTDRPAGFPMRPDLIHGHHIGPCMAAIAAHPDVPALFVSHDASAPHDALPRHPRIRRMFAVDERCRARLVAEGAEPASVEILPNAVDLSRISPRRPLPAYPVRAVALTKHAAHMPALRAACSAAGIALEEYGSGIGKIVERPETIFAEADLVFATARTALEASAAGAGVIVCDERGCAGFLTRANAEAWLPYNLGAGILARPCDTEQIVAAIADWSAEEAAAASALVRERCGLEPWLDRLEAIYSEILEQASPHDPAAEAATMGNFIADWVPNYNQQAPWQRLAVQVSSPPPASPIDALERGLTAVVQKVDDLVAAQSEALTTIARKVDSLAAAQSEASTTTAQRVDSLAAAQLEALTTIAQKVDGLAAAQPEALKIIAQKADSLAASQSEGLTAVAQKVATIAQKVDSLMAAQSDTLQTIRLSPGIRLQAVLRGLYRCIVPLRLREPLYRFRQRMLGFLLR
jgi:hypothetical protein